MNNLHFLATFSYLVLALLPNVFLFCSPPVLSCSFDQPSRQSSRSNSNRFLSDIPNVIDFRLLVHSLTFPCFSCLQGLLFCSAPLPLVTICHDRLLPHVCMYHLTVSKHKSKRTYVEKKEALRNSVSSRPSSPRPRIPCMWKTRSSPINSRGCGSVLLEKYVSTRGRG